jgi:hypothetical protein
MYEGTINAAGARNIGYLWETKTISNARLFYCLSGVNIKAGTSPFLVERTYEAYVDRATGRWPVFNGNDRVRAGYSYFPQSGSRTLSTRTVATKPPFNPPGFATKASDLSANYAIASDLIYRLDMITHRARVKQGLALNALFGDMHVSLQTDPRFFDQTTIWTSTMNGQVGGGGIEDRGDNFRWLIMNFRPGFFTGWGLAKRLYGKKIAVQESRPPGEAGFGNGLDKASGIFLPYNLFAGKPPFFNLKSLPLLYGAGAARFRYSSNCLCCVASNAKADCSLGVGVRAGRTRRNPTNGASRNHQMLLGSLG